MSNEIFNASQPNQEPQKLSGLSQEVGFDIPVESVTLPSRGLAYAPDHPLCNEDSVEIKCMTAKEEDLLTSRALIKNGTVISQLLRSCILNKTVDPDDMLVGDRNAVLIAIRVTGYGSEYAVKIGCPSCSEEYDNEFSLSGLKVKPLTGTPATPNANLFEYTLPLSGLKIHFKLLTGRDELEISKVSDKKKKLQTQIDNSITSRLLYSIVSVGGETDRNKIAKVVNNMRAGDSRALRKHIDSIEPGVEMRQSSTCPHCNEESEVNVPLGITFFWPDLGN
jgi:hypothetical protein